MTIALIIIGVLVYLFLGYLLWSYTNDNYDYNIFSIGTIIRGIGILICVGIAIGEEDTTYLFVAGILLLWNFIATWVKSNIFIALGSLFYQIIASLLVVGILNKITKVFSGDN